MVARAHTRVGNHPFGVLGFGGTHPFFGIVFGDGCVLGFGGFGFVLCFLGVGGTLGCWRVMLTMLSFVFDQLRWGIKMVGAHMLVGDHSTCLGGGGCFLGFGLGGWGNHVFGPFSRVFGCFDPIGCVYSIQLVIFDESYGPFCLGVSYISLQTCRFLFHSLKAML